MDLSKQQALHADPKAIYQINLEIQKSNQQYFLLLEKQKKTVLDFSQGTANVF